MAYYLATAGLDVLVLEKSRFPREKVCGDGLTPRAVKALTAMGVPIGADDGWLRNKGLRIIGGGGRIEVDWPDLSSYPGYGLVRTRLDFDQILARHAEKAGARLLEGMTVTGPVLDDRTGRIVGVIAQETAAGKDAPPRQFRGRLVVAADGNSSRLSVSMGLRKRDDRPLGVAVRTYYTSPRHDDDYLEAWLDLWDGSSLLPGYGWIFGMGDGTSNVGPRPAEHLRLVPEHRLPRAAAPLAGRHARRVGLHRGEPDPAGPRRRPADGLQPHPALHQGPAAGRRRGRHGQPVQRRGHRLRAGVRRDRGPGHRPGPGPADGAADAERVLQTYPRMLKDSYGGYYTLGRVFVELIGKPSFMQFATRHGVKRPAVMRFTMKLLGNLTETRGGDAVDRLINAVSKMTPAA